MPSWHAPTAQMQCLRSHRWSCLGDPSPIPTHAPYKTHVVIWRIIPHVLKKGPKKKPQRQAEEMGILRMVVQGIIKTLNSLVRER